MSMRIAAMLPVVVCSLAQANVVGYWNFNNMELSAPPSDWAYPVPSSLPGPLGLVCDSSLGLFRLPYNHPSFNAPSPNGANALAGDADGFGLRVGNGDSNFIRNGGVISLPLSSMSQLQSLELSFMQYGGLFPVGRIVWRESSSAGWNTFVSFNPDAGWHRRQFNFGSLLDGLSTPSVGIVLDGGGEYAWSVFDNVQVTASPIPALPTLAMIASGLGLYKRQREALRG